MNPDPNPISPAVPPASDPYHYGWRYVERRLPDGRVEVDQVGLTLEDVLHPQEEDSIPQSPRHQIDRSYLAMVLRTRVERLKGGLVLSNCLVDWGVEGIRNHCPDVSVFQDLRTQPSLNFGTFRLAASGGKCLLVIEVVSPHTRVVDAEWKVRDYHAAGVALYVLIDQERSGGPRQIRAFQHHPEGYVLVPLDAHGRVSLGPLGISLGLKDDGVACYGNRSGERIRDYEEVLRAHGEVAENTRQSGDARLMAGDSLREDAEARREAELSLLRMKERIQELEAEICRLRGETHP
jgi:colicin import membrane protein